MSWQAILKYPAIFLAGLLVTWLLTPIWRHFAPRWGFLDRPGGRKIHHRPIPHRGRLGAVYRLSGGLRRFDACPVASICRPNFNSMVVPFFTVELCGCPAGFMR